MLGTIAPAGALQQAIDSGNPDAIHQAMAAFSAQAAIIQSIRQAQQFAVTLVAQTAARRWREICASGSHRHDEPLGWMNGLLIARVDPVTQCVARTALPVTQALGLTYRNIICTFQLRMDDKGRLVMCNVFSTIHPCVDPAQQSN